MVGLVARVIWGVLLVGFGTAAMAGGPSVVGETTLIENRPPDDIFGAPGLYLSLRADVSHPNGLAGFSGPPARATSEANNNGFPYVNPVPLPTLQWSATEHYFVGLVPIVEADFPNLRGRYNYRVWDVNDDMDSLLSHNLNRLEVIPLPTNLAVSNQTTTPTFTFTDPDPTPNVSGLVRVYHVLVVDSNLAGVGHFPPPGGAPTPSIAIPAGVLCPCRSYHFRAESVDADTADGAAENLASAFMSFTPTDVLPNGDMTKDCVTNGRDIQAFVAAVVAGSSAAGDLCSADFDGNGVIGVGDVAGFVGSLLAGG